MILSKTQKLILNKSLELFSQHGYKSTTISMIAKACDLNELTIYRNFNNKEQLFNRCLSYTVSELSIPESFANFEYLPVQEFLKSVADLYLELCIINTNLYKIQLLISDDFENFKKLVLTDSLILHFEKSLQNYHSTSNYNHDVKTFSKLFFASILGFFTVYILNSSIISFNELEKLKNLQVNTIIEAYYPR